MKLTVRDFDLTKLAISAEQDMVRSEGVHVSHIIRHISQTVGQKESGFSEDDLNQFAVIGRLWEKTLADAMYIPPRYERIGEIELDNIIGSPDAVDFDDCAVHELKVTWVSAKNFTDRLKFRMYLWQGAAYCQMLGWCRCIFDVLHVRGDYTTGVPIARQYVVEFTPGHLKENFEMLKRNIP